MDEALRLVPSLRSSLWLSCDQLAVGWQVGVVATQMDATLQARPPLIVEGHNIAIHSIREGIKFGNLQGFGTQLYDAAFRFHNVHMERKHLHVCLCLCEPGQKKHKMIMLPYQKENKCVSHFNTSRYPGVVPVQSKLDSVLL